MYMFICFASLFVATCRGQEAEIPNDLVVLCKSQNAYYEIPESCDSYVECRDEKAAEMTCPDGLNFDRTARWPAYPCGYPMDVPCIGGKSIQPAQVTPGCPHQYGFFPHPQSSLVNCGQYLMCASGRAIEMDCPIGLAFNPAISRCDWPELVPTCDVEKFLGFRCPDSPLNAEALNYRLEGTCQYFFRCEGGLARLLSCDADMAFDDASGRCKRSKDVQCDEGR